MIDTLCIFDFDETLFRSPQKPKSFEGNWKISKESLSEPYVPEIPSDFYWNLNVVKQAKNCINNENNYCILLTGRIDNIFEERIKKLLNQKNLNFREVHLNQFGEDTVEFKIEKINNILRRNKNIKYIKFWDDKREYLEKFSEEFNNSYVVSTTLITKTKIKFN